MINGVLCQLHLNVLNVNVRIQSKMKENNEIEWGLCEKCLRNNTKPEWR